MSRPFVAKNGLTVNTSLIVANSTANTVSLVSNSFFANSSQTIINTSLTSTEIRVGANNFLANGSAFNVNTSATIRSLDIGSSLFFANSTHLIVNATANVSIRSLFLSAVTNNSVNGNNDRILYWSNTSNQYFMTSISGLISAGFSGVQTFNSRAGAVMPANGDYVASQITVTANGNITNTQVQGALQQLDSIKANIASPTFTGVPSAPTAANGTNNTQIATTAYVQNHNYINATSVASIYAPINNPNFTGIPTAPTAANGTNNTQIATTAYVQNHNYVNGSFVSSTYAPIANPVFSTAIIANTSIHLRGLGAGLEGGHITLGYGNNLATSINGQANNTWNIDVDAANNFRVFRQNGSGVIATIFSVNPNSAIADFAFMPTVGGANLISVNGGTFIGNVTFSSNVTFDGSVSGNVTFSGNSLFSGNVQVNNNLTVSGNSVFSSNVSFNNIATFTANTNLNGVVNISNTSINLANNTSISVNNNVEMFFAANGNIGFNTQTPNTAVHIVGDTRIAGNLLGGSHSISAHSDVNTSGITSGQSLVWNGSQFVPGSGGGGGFRGNSGLVGTSASGDIFRVHAQTLTSNTTIASNENAMCAGPLTVAVGVTLTVDVGGNLVVV